MSVTDSSNLANLLHEELDHIKNNTNHRDLEHIENSREIVKAVKFEANGCIINRKK